MGNTLHAEIRLDHETDDRQGGKTGGKEHDQNKMKQNKTPQRLKFVVIESNMFCLECNTTMQLFLLLFLFFVLRPFDDGWLTFFWHFLLVCFALFSFFFFFFLFYFIIAIVAGTPLRGKVIVQVKKGVDKCKSVTLEVSGKERTAAYQYLDYGTMTHPYNRHENDDDDDEDDRKLV
jgi:hypothetical protein